MRTFLDSQFHYITLLLSYLNNLKVVKVIAASNVRYFDFAVLTLLTHHDKSCTDGRG